MTRISALLVLPVAAAVSACQNDAGMAGGQAMGGDTAGEWVTLFDGSHLDHFTTVGDANWRLVGDGVVEADSGRGWLVTNESYDDFHMTVEFWTSPDANSGVFIRCSDLDDIAAATTYEVNVFDQRPDQTYRTGSIVEFAAPMVQIDAANQWNRFEITAEGTHLLVRLNGQVTVDIEDDTFDSGPIALQYAAGTVRFRNVRIMPL